MTRRRDGRSIWPFLRRAGLAAVGLSLLATGCRGAGAPEIPALTLSPETPAKPTSPALPTSVPSPSANGMDTLRGDVGIWMDWPPAETRWLSEALSEFTRRHPRVSVTLRYIPTESFRQTVFQESARSDGPTVILAPSAWATELFDAGLTQDISLRVSPALRSQLTPIAWTQAQDGDRTLAVPIELQGTVLYRNPALASTVASTVEEMGKSASSLLARGARPLVLDLGMRASMPFMSACGGTIMLVEGDLQVDESVGVCWLTLLQRMGMTGAVASAADSDLDAFLAGEAGWLVDSVEQMARLEQGLGLEGFSVDPWPLYGETSRPLSGYTWALNAYLRSGLTVDEAEASWAFIQFLLSPDVQAARSRIPGAAHVPVLAEPGESPEHIEQVRAILLGNTPFPLARDLATFTTPIERAARLVARQAGEPARTWRRAMETLRVQPSPSPP
jgi:ABC-type glycerol-3-phosphate transport system substrate-binding protein